MADYQQMNLSQDRASHQTTSSNSTGLDNPGQGANTYQKISGKSTGLDNPGPNANTYQKISGNSTGLDNPGPNANTYQKISVKSTGLDNPGPNANIDQYQKISRNSTGLDNPGQSVNMYQRISGSGIGLDEPGSMGNAPDSQGYKSVSAGPVTTPAPNTYQTLPSSESQPQSNTDKEDYLVPIERRGGRTPTSDTQDHDYLDLVDDTDAGITRFQNPTFRRFDPTSHQHVSLPSQPHANGSKNDPESRTSNPIAQRSGTRNNNDRASSGRDRAPDSQELTLPSALTRGKSPRRHQDPSSGSVCVSCCAGSQEGSGGSSVGSRQTRGLRIVIIVIAFLVVMGVLALLLYLFLPATTTGSGSQIGGSGGGSTGGDGSTDGGGSGGGGGSGRGGSGGGGSGSGGGSKR